MTLASWAVHCFWAVVVVLGPGSQGRKRHVRDYYDSLVVFEVVKSHKLPEAGII